MHGTRDQGWQLGALAALAKDPGSVVLGTHMYLTTISYSQPQGI